MPCMTCNHTVQNLGVDGQKIFWCPRCGTIKSVDAANFESVSVPKLADAVRNVPSERQNQSVSSVCPGAWLPRWWWEAMCEAVGRKA